MKFGDKLQNLRKASSLSQEQLADKLNVSRQAVSKWESNASYPEMDKLIAMCKLFKCSMDDLVNDEVKDKEIINKKETSTNNNYVTSFINFFIESFNMFFSMKLKTLIKTLVELFIIGFILFSGAAIILSILSNLVDQSMYYSKIASFIVTFIDTFIVLSFMVIFITIYKSRYLNYYLKEKYKKNQIDDLNIENNESENKEKIEFKDEKIDFKNNEPKFIIRDRKESSFMNTLITLFTLCVKAFILAFITPFVIFTFIIFIVLAVESIYLMFYNLFFLGTSIALIGGTLFIVLVLEFIYRFLFNSKLNVKRYGIMFLISFIAIGIGGGICLVRLKDFNTINFYSTDTFNKTIEYSDNLVISSPTELIIDNNIKDIEVSFDYNKDFEKVSLSTMMFNGKRILIINDENNEGNAFDFFRYFIDNLKNNNIVIEDYYYKRIKIKTNETNAIKLLKNTSSYYHTNIVESNGRYLFEPYGEIDENDICTINKNGYYECIKINEVDSCEATVDEFNRVKPKNPKKCICEEISKRTYDCYLKDEDLNLE